MKTGQGCRVSARPGFEVMLQNSIEDTVTFQLLRALRRSNDDLARWQSWQVTDCQLAYVDDWQGLQFQARGIIGQPWLQVLLHPDRRQGWCRLGTVRRGRFHVMAESRYVPLHRLNLACDSWGRVGRTFLQEARYGDK